MLLLNSGKQQHSKAPCINTIKYCLLLLAGSLAGRSNLRCLLQRFPYSGFAAHLAYVRAPALASCSREWYVPATITVDVIAVLQLC